MPSDNFFVTSIELLVFITHDALTCAPMGYSWTRAPMWGGGCPPPVICQTTGPVLDPKTAFGSLVFELSEYVAKFYL